jgi:hypothetical protein
MKQKNIFFLLLWYIAGMAVFMKFNKKTPEIIKKEIENKDKCIDVFLNNFIQIHKDFFSFIKSNILSKENIKSLNEYKKLINKEVDKFKKEAELKISELKKMWIVKKNEIEKELEKIYNKKVVDLNDFINWWEWYLEEWKKILLKAFKDLQKKLNNSVKSEK